MTGIARQTQFQQTHYLRKTFNYNDVGVSAGVLVGTVPAGALFTNVHARVRTAFNAGTTNVITVGTNAGGPYNDLVAGGTIVPGTVGGYGGVTNTVVGNVAALTADTDVFAVYTQTGTAATAGVCDIVVTYIPNNDK